MQKPNQKAPVSSKAPNQGVLCNFKIKKESQNLELGGIKTIVHIQIKIKMPNPSQEPPASSNAPNEDFNNMDVLCTLKIKIESQNLDHECIKDQLQYPNQDQDTKLQSENSSIPQSPI